MKLAVDIGGTKTLLTVFDDTNHELSSVRFETPKPYEQFLEQFEEHVQQVRHSAFSHCAAAAPGRLDRKLGTVLSCGNLPWKNMPIQRDLSKIVGCPVAIENDAKLAALFEAQNVKHEHNKALYLTISTGIGAGVITNGVIDPTLQDCEVGSMLLPHDGESASWESFASGQAIHEKHAILVSDIPDASPLWNEIAQNLAPGIFNCCSVIQPDVIIIGGGAGMHLAKFIKPLKDELKKIGSTMVTIPPMYVASKPDKAVVYGCLTLMNQ